MIIFAKNKKTMKSMTSKYSLLFLLLIPLFAFTIHKHYISLTKIEFVPQHKAVQITMRFFIDDVEKVLEDRYETELELATPDESSRSNELMELYIMKKFEVVINGQEETLNYLGKEYDNDLVLFYVEIENIEKIESIEVTNAMLFEEFPEQKNYIKLKIGEVDKTFILVKSNDKEMLKL